MSISTKVVSEIPARPVQAMPTTFAYFAAFVAMGLVSASLGPTLSRLADNTDSQLGQISFLFTARSFGYLIGSYLAGRLYDRLSGNPIMAVMVLLMAVTMAVAPLMSVLWLLALVLFGMGIGEGSVDVGGNVLLVWVHRSRVGPYMNGLHFFFGVGAFIAPIVVAQMVVISGDILWAYWVLALLIVPVSLWLLRLPSPSRQQATRGGSAVRTNVVLTGLIALFMFFYVGAEVSFGGWIYTYAVTLQLTSPTTAAYLTSVFWGALTVGRLAAIPIAVRVRPRTIVIADLAGCLASVGVILLWPASMTAVWIGTFGLGFAMASIFPTLISWAERRMALSGGITSVFLIGSSLGAMTFPLLIGQMFDARGPQVVMLMVFGLLLLECLMFGVLMAYGGPPTMDDEDDEEVAALALGGDAF